MRAVSLSDAALFLLGGFLMCLEESPFFSCVLGLWWKSKALLDEWQ